MREPWLQGNRRALAAGLVVPLLLLVAGLICLLGPFAVVVRWIGGGVLIAAGLLAASLVWMMFTPRLAYEDGWLLVYLSSTVPERVPIDHVECFFLGQAASLMPREAGSAAKTRAVVVRLAEAARDYQFRSVRPSLGQWCDGYITIRGTWCEPIDSHLMRRLNERLLEIQRARRDQSSSADATSL
jgi:hypothetical protein